MVLQEKLKSEVSMLAREHDELVALDQQAEDFNSDVDESPSPAIHALKLIDFAHASWNPGQGPDQNFLSGLSNVIKILKSLRGKA